MLHVAVEELYSKRQASPPDWIITIVAANGEVTRAMDSEKRKPWKIV